MASYRRIEVRPVAGALGAEIAGVNLGRLDDDTFKEIKAAWLEHLVIFFRDQNITPEQQIAFAKRFGDIHHHPFMKGMDEYPDIFEIIKEEGDTKAFGEVWHTDQAFNPKPAKATILYAKETPSAGGDTLFTNLYLAYETLSEPMKALLADVKTWNVGDRKKLMHAEKIGVTPDGRYAGNEKMSAKLRDPGDLQTEAAHPLVRTHPETGRKALYLSNHTQTLDGSSRGGQADPGLPGGARGGAGVHMPVPLASRLDGDLGQPLHPAPRAQRLSRQAPAHASHHHRGRRTVLTASGRDNRPGPQVAGGEMAGPDLAHERRFDPAARFGIGAARVEMTAGRRLDRARHVALQDDALGLGIGVGYGDRRQQRLRIGMLRCSQTARASRPVPRCGRDT